jgi:protein O-mannosyl-transferase
VIADRPTKKRRKTSRTQPPVTSAQKGRLFVAASVLVMTFIAFAPALLNQFVDWDDTENFLTNTHYRGLGWAHLKWMWTTFLLGHWVPVTWMTLGLDYLVWEMNPAGYHLSNVLLHSANAAVFYLIALRLLRAAMPLAVASDALAWRLSAAFAALLFAVHPLRAEPVAWVTERRDVLSGLFYLVAIWAYLREAEVAGPRSLRMQRWYWVSLGCFVLALLSKAITVTLPVVLVVLDVYPLRRLGPEAGGWWSPRARRRWVEKVPFVLASAVVISVTLVAARSGATPQAWASFGFLDRLAVSLYGLAFYLRKTVLPIGLSPLYALSVPIAPSSAPYLVSALLVAVITVLAILLRSRWPALSAVWVVYVATLLPVSGIFQVGPQICADRYSYLSSLPWAMLAGAGVLAVRCVWSGRTHGRSIVYCTTGAAVVVVAALMVLTWRQVQVWRDPERLWSHALAIGESSMAHEHLGYLRRQQGRLTEATEHYTRASSLRPDRVRLWVELGDTLAQQGMLSAAIGNYQEALRQEPGGAAPHIHWGNALVVAGQSEEALHHYREAVRIDPSNADALNSWGRALAMQGRWEEAITKYRQALGLRPDSIPYYNWGNALFAAGRLDEAISRYREAVRIDPDMAEAYNNWGRVLAQQGKWGDAITKYREALRIRPSYSLASANLENAILQADKAPGR